MKQQDLEIAIQGAVAKNPSSMMGAAGTLRIPYKTFMRYVIQMGIYKQNDIVWAAIVQQYQLVLQVAGIVGIPFMPTQRRHQSSPEHAVNKTKDKQVRYTPLIVTGVRLEDVLDGKHPQYPTKSLKRWLIACGVKANVCEACGLGTIWIGKPLVLALDHIDGDNTNHRYINVRMLCPNCHSQTDTYCGRNADQHKRRYVSEADFVDALRQEQRISDALKRLGLVESETWYKKARRLIAKYHIEHFSDAVSNMEMRTLNSHGNIENDRLDRERYLVAQQPLIRNVIGSSIDFRQPGWANEVANLIGQEPEAVHAWMQDVMPEFYERRCFKKNQSDHSDAA